MAADMDTALHSSHLALEHAARTVDAADARASRALTQAVLICTTQAVAVTSVALQLGGGRAYSTRSALERYFRDARAGTFMVGSTEGLRDMLGSDVLGVE